MTEAETAFFSGKPEAFSIYSRLVSRLRTIEPELLISVRKTQISFFSRYMFACVSFLRVRRGVKDFLTLTVGLPYKSDSPRIDQAVEVRPGRWTHHIMLTSAAELDDEIFALLAEAADFSSVK